MRLVDVPRETGAQLAALKALVLEEAEQQNLVSAATIPQFDERHLTDSLQLAAHMPPGVRLDIGSGGGFPGLVLACLTDDPIHLVEPRRKRADFLSRVAEALGLAHVTVHAAKVERVILPAVAVITARAVANLDALFTIAAHIADEKTRWVLPKGRSAASELAEAERTWQGRFQLVPSITDAEASIVLADAVRRRPAR